MDDHTFRRLAPDAVAGRLDDSAYAEWKAYARGNPEREGFIARVAAAHERLSGRSEVVRDTEAKEVPRRIPKRVFWMLAPFFALFGALGGGLVMHSFLRTKQTVAQLDNTGELQTPPPANNQPAGNTVGEEPADEPDNKPERERPQPDDETEPQPEPEPEPQTEAEPDPDTTGFCLVAGQAKVRLAGTANWQALARQRALQAGDRVAVLEDDFKFSSDRVTIHGHGRSEFELTANGFLLVEGELTVRVNRACSFKTHKTAWTMDAGAFVAKPGRFGGELYLLEGAAQIAYHENTADVTAPMLVQLDANLTRRALTPEEIRTWEGKLLGPHDALLRWDAETTATTPELGEVCSPGAFGEGYAMCRALGQLEIGAAPAGTLFTAGEGTRLRMRVKTSARHLLIEMRVRLDEGYRAVDAKLPVPAGDDWVVIDVPLSLLRAGRGRDEPGWIPGRQYSAFTISPAVDPARPLLRHDLSVDDVLVYLPR